MNDPKAVIGCAGFLLSLVVMYFSVILFSVFQPLGLAFLFASSMLVCFLGYSIRCGNCGTRFMQFSGRWITAPTECRECGSSDEYRFAPRETWDELVAWARNEWYL
jgi:hypothetical protein